MTACSSHRLAAVHGSTHSALAVASVICGAPLITFLSLSALVTVPPSPSLRSSQLRHFVPFLLFLRLLGISIPRVCRRNSIIVSSASLFHRSDLQLKRIGRLYHVMSPTEVLTSCLMDSDKRLKKEDNLTKVNRMRSVHIRSSIRGVTYSRDDTRWRATADSRLRPPLFALPTHDVAAICPSFLFLRLSLSYYRWFFILLFHLSIPFHLLFLMSLLIFLLIFLLILLLLLFLGGSTIGC
eukprot:GHVU01102201.1.p1 GENE.GHVU01102201.1~~GHVU01102201.1.p1  ORF type:complete len:239 (-),score=21.45 GHVU01102201.1:8-724(-)